MVNEQEKPQIAERCNVAPHGWVCSRERGHKGPCAASPTILDDYVGYMRIKKGVISACSSDSDGAFKVYRASRIEAAEAALEHAKRDIAELVEALGELVFYSDGLVDHKYLVDARRVLAKHKEQPK